MKIVMTLLVRDEEDIVAANLDFHLSRGVDHVIATDNLSTDATAAILRSYEGRGLLTYIHEPDDTYDQHRWVTRMARMAAVDFGADWVINNDADEFWWPEGGDLKEVLGAVPPDSEAAAAPRSNFLPRPPGPGRSFAETMVVRERRSRKPMGGGDLPGKVCHRGAADIEVAQGNHAALRNGRPLAAAAAAITILHFPLRSYAQFENKIVKGGAAYDRNDRLPPRAGAAWRRLYELWRDGALEPYYRSQTPDDATIEAGLADGTLILDERLKLALRQLASAASAGGPDDPAPPLACGP